MNSFAFNPNPVVSAAGKFFIKCGYYSFLYGIINNTVDTVIFSDPYTISKKYSLPACLKPATQLIGWFEQFTKILYGGITNGLIGLTWPVSVPLIQFWYRSNPSNSSNQSRSIQGDTTQGK